MTETISDNKTNQFINMPEVEITTRFEDVKTQTTEDYFQNNQFSIDAFNKKYTLFDGETYVMAIKRVCDFIASAEKTNKLKTYWSNRWFDEIYNDWWHPAGSIMQGAGSEKKISLSNCTCISLGNERPDEEWDNLESIIKNSSYAIAKTAAYRQGLGIDFSRLRPNKAKIMNSANEGQGCTHWMKFADSIGYYVGQKGRIPAFLFSLKCSHPDVEEFIKIKSDYTKIQNANISVQCTDDFYKAIETNSDWDLSFEIPEVKIGQKVYIDIHSTDMDSQYDKKKKRWYYIAKKHRPFEKISKKVNAKELMELIAKCMHANAEPGIQNIDIARKYSNSDYVYNPEDIYDSRIVGTNAPLIGSTKIPTKNKITTIKELYEKYEQGNNIELISDTISSLPKGHIDWLQNKNQRGINYFPTQTFPVPAKIKKFPNQKVWKIVLSNQKELFCNGEHSWLVNGEMTPTKNIKAGDKMFSPNGGVVDAYGIEPNFESQPFKDGELIGYIVGDGWIGKKSNIHNESIGIVYDEDCEYYSKLFRKKFFEITGTSLNYERDRGKIKEVRTESTKFVQWVKSFGFDKNKNHTPARCFEDIDFCRGFLRGLFQADSHVELSKRQSRVTLTSVSKSLILDVESLLSNWFGIYPTIKESECRGVPYGDGKISNAKNRFDLRFGRYDFIDKFTKNVGLIGKKGEKLFAALKNNNQRNIRNFKLVTSVEETDDVQDMYCAVVDGIHSFVANGCLSSNCSEQYLSRDGLCVLSSENMGRFDTDPEIYEKQQERISYSMNRFLDDVNTMEIKSGTYATPFQKIGIEKLRRTGAGVTNIDGWLFKKGLQYGTPEANEAVAKLIETFNYYLYKSSIEIGKEKGSFGLFDRSKFEKSPFIKRMIEKGLIFETIRNCTCSSIAPTGTISLMFRGLVYSYGIEPSFGVYFWKRTRMSGNYEYYFYVPYVVRELLKKSGINLPMEGDCIKDTIDGKYGKPIAKIIDEELKNINFNFKESTEIKAMDKLDLMAKVMKWIDSSISVTYMLPENSKWQDVYDFIIEAHKKEVKSIACFPDKKMYGIVSLIPFLDLAVNLTNEGVEISDQNFSEDEIDLLKKLTNRYQEENVENKIIKTTAPKRPKLLPCDMHHIKVTKKLDKIRTFDYIVFVGLLHNNPYEVFVMENGHINKKHKQGTITKKKRGVYGANFDEESIEDITSNSSETEDILTRLVSTSLRHGADIAFIVEQLEKSEGDLFCFSKAISRVLKKYIKDGSVVNGISCQKCGGKNMIRQCGCAVCGDCGYSKCE